MTTHRLPLVTHPDALGVPLDTLVDAHPNSAEVVHRAVDDEVQRMNQVFAPWDPDSDFSRWRRGLDVDPSSGTDLAQVLAASERFWVFSKGAFHPHAEALRQRWLQARVDGEEPTTGELKALAEALTLPYSAVNGPLRRTGDCSRVDITTIARGHLLDAALQAGWRLGLASGITLRTATTIRHRGAGGITVDVSGGSLRVTDATLARWSRSPDAPVGSASQLEVLDPRTGTPQSDIVAVTALAADALTAEALVCVVRVGDASVRGALPGTAWLAEHRDGSTSQSDNWPHIGGVEAV